MAIIRPFPPEEPDAPSLRDMEGWASVVRREKGEDHCILSEAAQELPVMVPEQTKMIAEALTAERRKRHTPTFSLAAVRLLDAALVSFQRAFIDAALYRVAHDVEDLCADDQDLTSYGMEGQGRVPRRSMPISADPAYERLQEERFDKVIRKGEAKGPYQL